MAAAAKKRSMTLPLKIILTEEGTNAFLRQKKR